MVRVKICGITTPEDARFAAEAGADAIGLNFVGGPRKIAPKQAARIVAALPPFCEPVALVNLDTNPIGDALWDCVRHLPIRTVQLYGTDPHSTHTQFPNDAMNPIIVHAVKPDSFPGDLEDRLVHFSAPARAVVLDAHDPDQLGGTGKTFDWDFLKRSMDESDATGWPPVILAGGLNPQNVAEAIRIAQPWAVDVSSGVEDSPGLKSAERMHDFVRAAKA